jgi:cytoskeletal protein RodZ
MDTAGDYLQATSSVSRVSALLMTVVGIILVGALLFGTFWGARWAYAKLTDTDPKTVSAPNTAPNTSPNTPTNQTTPQPSTPTPPTNNPSITATSSTSTTTPTSPAPQPAQNRPASVPNTGAGSNIALFTSLLALSYLVARRKMLKRL